MVQIHAYCSFELGFAAGGVAPRILMRDIHGAVGMRPIGTMVEIDGALLHCQREEVGEAGRGLLAPVIVAVAVVWLPPLNAGRLAAAADPTP